MKTVFGELSYTPNHFIRALYKWIKLRSYPEDFCNLQGEAPIDTGVTVRQR